MFKPTTIAYFVVAGLISLIAIFTCRWNAGEPASRVSPVFVPRKYELSVSGNPPTLRFNGQRGIKVKQFTGFTFTEWSSSGKFVTHVWSIRSMNPDFTLKALEYGTLPNNWTEDGKAVPLLDDTVYDVNNEYCFKRDSRGLYSVFESPLRTDSRSVLNE